MPPSGKVLTSANVTAMKLEAFKYYYIPAGHWLRGHCCEADVGIAQAAGGPNCAASPFMVETGPIGAFVTTPTMIRSSTRS